jgi:hypothetical protein
MPIWRFCSLFFIPYCLIALTLDQKVTLKLIESLWNDGSFAQAEEEINKFLSKHKSMDADENLLKLQADLLIKKKDYASAFEILNKILDHSDFVKERRLLCLYELKDWDQFLISFEEDPSLKNLAFGKKIWDLGLAQAISHEQNIEKKQNLIQKATHLFTEDLEENFDHAKALSLALICEDQKDFKKAYKLYEELYLRTNDEAYQLSMARALSHFDSKRALEILNTLRWKSGSLGTTAALFSMEIYEKNQDFHELYSLSLEELKMAPEGYRKAKIALYHLKSLYYLKCFDRIADFYFAYNPHKLLKNQDQSLAINLISKSFLIKNEIKKLDDLYNLLKKDNFIQCQVISGRILAKHYIEHKDFLSAQKILEELQTQDVLHLDEYLTTLGFCYLHMQAYEVAENYFFKVITSSPDQLLRKKAIQHLVDLPNLSQQTLLYLTTHTQDIDLKASPKALFWIIEALKNEGHLDKALDLLKTFGHPDSSSYHQLMGELLEKKTPEISLSHFEKALKLSESDNIKAYLHGKLFVSYFDFDKDLAADHLFNSINLHNVSIPQDLLEGLTAHLYDKAFQGIKIHLGQEEAKKAASQLVRLLSYKSDLSDKDKVLYGKALRKLHRIDESYHILKNGQSFHEKLEMAQVLNILGKYEECDQLFESLIKQKPYTLFLEGQRALLNKICLQYDRLKAQTDPNIKHEDLEKQLRVLQVCIQGHKCALSFEAELIKRLFFSKNNLELADLRFHPFLDNVSSGAHRKILNFLINQKLDRYAALSIEEPLSEPLEWILLQNFRNDHL